MIDAMFVIACMHVAHEEVEETALCSVTSLLDAAWNDSDFPRFPDAAGAASRLCWSTVVCVSAPRDVGCVEAGKLKRTRLAGRPSVAPSMCDRTGFDLDGSDVS